MRENHANLFQEWAIKTIAKQEPSNWNLASRIFIEKTMSRESIKNTLLSISDVLQPKIGDRPKAINQHMFLELASYNDNDGSMRVVPERGKHNSYKVTLESGDADSPTTTDLRFEDGVIREKNVLTKVKGVATLSRTTISYDKSGISQILSDEYTNQKRTSTNIWVKKELASGPGLVRYHTDFDRPGSWDHEEKSDFYIPFKLMKNHFFTQEEVYGPITREFEGKYDRYKISGLKIRIG